MKALFPGSFDPFTIGHEALVRRSLKMFDEIVVAVGDNKQKHTMFSLEERMAVVRAVFKDECRVKVDSYQDLTVDYCKKNDIQYIVRGVLPCRRCSGSRGCADGSCLLSSRRCECRACQKESGRAWDRAGVRFAGGTAGRPGDRRRA